ncbi:MAG: hypothetical protein EAZ20_11045, partial [Bacteroidetes bacterium]
ATSSENRKYIPMAFFEKDDIVNNTCLFIPDADLYLFGILSSAMHMAWVKRVCGRLKSDFRYSNEIVYNNFPFPENITPKQSQKVKEAAQKVLEARNLYLDTSLADMYHVSLMPVALVKAHQNLDKAVDECYDKKAFEDDEQRLFCLFTLYEKYINPLLK